MAHLSHEHVHFSSALATWLLAVLSITLGHEPHVKSFVLPASNSFLHLFWVFTVVVQGIYLFEFFNKADQEVKQHFVLNNVLLFAWYWSYHKGPEALALVFAALLLASGYTTYFRGGTYSTHQLRNWLGVHIPVTVLPFVWGLYLTFTHAWNVLDLPHKILGVHSEIIAVVAWFLIGGALLLNYADWGVGIATGLFALSIASTSHKHGIDSYAGVGGAVLVIGSVYLAYARPRGLQLSHNDQAPLLG